MTAFADSSFLIGLFNQQDNFHLRAVKIATALKNKATPIIITNIALGEAINVVFRTHGAKKASQFYSAVLKTNLKIFNINEEIFSQGLKLLFKQKSKTGLNFFDCLHLATMDFLKIKTILTFDKDFQKSNVAALGINSS